MFLLIAVKTPATMFSSLIHNFGSSRRSWTIPIQFVKFFMNKSALTETKTENFYFIGNNLVLMFIIHLL